MREDPTYREATLDADAVREFRKAFIAHENWFNAGRPDAHLYAWPIAGTRAAAVDGYQAYVAYRDWLSGVMLAFSGFYDMVDDIRSLVRDIQSKSPNEPRALLLAAAKQDDAFHGQWGNLFNGDVVWPGLTHESLSAYARKYEVEWPLRVLVCLRDLVDSGMCDPTLARFRDKGGRVKKGALAVHARAGFAQYPALQAVIRLAYSAKLRNVIAHNEYTIVDGTVRSLDGSYSETEAEVWAHIDAITAVQNDLVRLESTASHDPTTLASCGVLGVGWGRRVDTGMPHLTVLQLNAFQQYDRGAEWLHKVAIAAGTHELETTLGSARSQRGPLVPDLLPVLDSIRSSGMLVCQILGVVPCLHAASVAHESYDLPAGRFCVIGPAVTRTVPADVVAASS